jgi:hypothetical protein
MHSCKTFFRVVLALLLVCCLPAFAQSNTTSLTGVVTDTSGAILPGATVIIDNPATGFHSSEVSASKGEYSFEQISPGSYQVKVRAEGFAEQSGVVQLLVATPTKLNFKMTVGASETINVETGLAALNSTDATLGKPFDSAQIQNLPYLANNVLSLLSLQPGVLSLDGGAQTAGLNTDIRTGIVNGARQDQSNVSLDGVDNNDQNNGYAFNGVLRATRESVEEFRVTTTNGNADAGRSSGAQVSLVTRSGTNAFHGSAYEFYRDPGVAANNWFNKQAQLTKGQPNTAAKVLQHTYGGSFGAPIKKDKLFFFGAYEGFKQASNVVVTNTVPSVASPVAGTPTLNGVGGLVTGSVTYLNAAGAVTTLQPSDIAKMDPKCTANGTCPLGPGTDAAAIAYFKQFPLSNSNTAGDSYNTGGYTFASPAPIHQITNIARLDYAMTSKQTLFVRGNLQSDNQASSLQFPGQLANSNIFGNSKGIAAGHIWTINQSLANNFRFGFVRQSTATRGAGSQPYVNISGLTPLTSTTTSSIYVVPIYNYVDDFTYTKGRHTLQFGLNDRSITNNRFADSTLYPTGSISATLLATAAIAGKGTSLDPGAFGYAAVGASSRTFYNNAILANTGVVTSATQYVNYQIQGNTLTPAPAGTVPKHNYHSLEQEYYVQDQYKATSRLTLTAGLRYTYLGVPYETNGQQVAPTLSLDTFLKNRVAAANAGTSYNTRITVAPAGSANGQPNLWTPQKLNFAPRLAFAYATADNKTSIHGGFAIAFDHFGEGVVDYYDANGAFALSTAYTSAYGNVDTAPRFTGFRSVPLPAVSAAARTFPITPTDQNFSFVRSINSNIKTPYAETFNFSVQHEFARGLTVTGAYVGRLGRHVLSNLDAAQPNNLVDAASGTSYFQAATAYAKMIDSGVTVGNVPNSGYFQNVFPNASFTVAKATVCGPAGTFKGAQAYYASLCNGDRGNETDTLYNYDLNASASAGNQSFRFFFPQYSSIYSQSSVATSNYNGLQLSMRHALKYGLEYDVNYTYSKSMDLGSSPERSASNLIINTFNPSGNYAPSDFDVRHNLSANYSALLPFGKGTPFLNHMNGLMDRLIGGWSLNGLVHYSTAFPFSASATGTFGTNFDASSFRVKTGPIASGGHRYVTDPLAPYVTAFKTLTSPQAVANLRYAYPGETGQRNVFRGDGYLSMDDGLSKSFRTFEGQQFKISVEVFNVLNDVRFSTLTATSGTSTTTNGTSTKFGQYANLLVQPRQMQFSGKYTF